MPVIPLAELVPFAVGIALNPPAVVAVILMLSSAHPSRNALSFVAGWMTGLLVVGAVVLALGDAAAALGGPSAIGLVVKLALGVALVWLAFRQWRSHKQASGEKEMPGWMRSLDGFTGVKSFATAALFAGLNPKSLALNIAGVLVIVEAGLPVATQVIALVLFVVMASVTVAAPVVYHFVAPERSARALERAKDWLIANNAAVTSAVLLVLGIALLLSGVQGLGAL